MLVIVISWNVIIACITGGFLFSIAAISFAVAAASADATEETNAIYTPVYGEGANQLLSIKVTGIIGGSEDDYGSGGLFGGFASGYAIKEKLMTAAKDNTIKGVVLEVNSPGGTIYGSRAIADGVAYYKEHAKKPVYAHIEGMAASGGYWAAASTDKIIADYGSDTGSIGIIMGPFKYYDTVISEDGGIFGGGVITQNGIETTTFTAGTSKDVGNPYRRLTTTEVAQLQQSVNNEYANFVDYVSQRRNIPAQAIRDQIGAMTYDNKTAESYKLIDRTGSRETTYEALARAANIKNNDFTIVREETPLGFLGTLLSAAGQKPQPESKTATAPDLCGLTKRSLAYYGSTAEFCNTPK